MCEVLSILPPVQATCTYLHGPAFQAQQASTEGNEYH